MNTARDSNGGLAEYLYEAQGIGYDRIQNEVVTMVGLIGATTLTNPAVYIVQDGWDFWIEGISGFFQDAFWAPQNFTRIEFNIQDGKSLGSIFGQAVNMGALCSTAGASPIMYFDRPYKKFEQNAQLTLTWSRLTTGGAFDPPDVNVGVSLHGMKVRRVRAQ